MTDMLVRLYDLPATEPVLSRAAAAGVQIRRPNSWERSRVMTWVEATFSPGWAAECETAFASVPAHAFIAVVAGELVGFACHDCTRLNFFGPTGVAPAWRGRGIGVALLLVALQAMHEAGYAYAIIGGVGPAEFYTRTTGAIPIEGSTPGIYDFSLIRG